MTGIVTVIGEDELCCALGEQLVMQCLAGWEQASYGSINTRGITKLFAALPRYRTLAALNPVLCIADTDGACPVEMLSKLPSFASGSSFALRLAVKEADAWAMADRTGFARAFGVPANVVPMDPEDLADAKREVLRLAARSSKRFIRSEVPAVDDPSKPGSGYNQHLCAFVRSGWSATEAAQRSPSLARAVRALGALSS